MSLADDTRTGVLELTPAGARYYVTIDIDAFDPSIAPGTGTPSHGGFHLDPDRNAHIHPLLRSADGFYEEDCCWAAVAQAFPDLFTDFEKRCAEETIRHWYPEAWPRSLTSTPKRLREAAS